MFNKCEHVGLVTRGRETINATRENGSLYNNVAPMSFRNPVGPVVSCSNIITFNANKRHLLEHKMHIHAADYCTTKDEMSPERRQRSTRAFQE